MTNTVKTLIALLGIQAVIILWVNRAQKETIVDTNKPLIALDFTTLDKIVVSTSEKESCEIVKKENSWSLPAYYDFPASSEKVTELFKAFSELKESWPAGKTLLAAKQFLTTAEKFEKKFDLYKDGKLLQTVYIGNSPSFKKVHIRVEGNEKTYIGSFSSYEYASKASSWANQSLYGVAKSDLVSFEKDNLQLVAKEETKTFEWVDLQASEKMNDSETSLLINAAINPRFEKVLGKDSYAVGEKSFSYTLKLKTGDSIQYEFFKPLKKEDKEDKKEEKAKQESLVLKVSKYPYYFGVSSSEVTDIINLDRKQLLQNESEQESKTISLNEDKVAE